MAEREGGGFNHRKHFILYGFFAYIKWRGELLNSLAKSNNDKVQLPQIYLGREKKLNGGER